MSTQRLVSPSALVRMPTVRGAPSAFAHYRPVAGYPLAPGGAVPCRVNPRWEVGTLRHPPGTGNRAPAPEVSGSSRPRRNTTRGMEPVPPAWFPPVCLLATPLAHDSRSPTPTSNQHRKGPLEASTGWVGVTPAVPAVLVVSQGGTMGDRAPTTVLSATATDQQAVAARTRRPRPAACPPLRQAAPISAPNTARPRVRAAGRCRTSTPARPGVAARRKRDRTSDQVRARPVRRQVPAQLQPGNGLQLPALVPAGNQPRGISAIPMGRLWVRGPLPLRRWVSRRGRRRVIAW
jgi:hypothetical protein